MINRKITYTVTLVLALAASAISTVSIAQQSGERRGPPPEAIEACANLTEEAVCSFTSPRGDVTGQCMVSPKDSETLSCRPEGGQKKLGDKS